MNLRPASWSVSVESEIEELKLIIFGFLALIGDISLNHVPIASFANRCDKISLCPEMSSPKLSLDIRMPCEKLSCSDAFHDLDDFGRRELWRGREEIMDVIEIYAYFFKGYLVALFDFCAYLIEGMLAVRKTEYPLSILYRRYEVIVNLICRAFSFPDRSHTPNTILMVTDQQAGSELSS